jgi:hypothetical protein
MLRWGLEDERGVRYEEAATKGVEWIFIFTTLSPSRKKTGAPYKTGVNKTQWAQTVLNATTGDIGKILR